MDEKFLASMDSELQGWSDAEARLHAALEKDEFALFCQPIAALTIGERFPFAEILVRLREEERALLPPGDFLPVFEQFGMMPQLDRWVLRGVIRHLKGGSRIAQFTVNVSGQTLQDEKFAAFAAAELQGARLPMDAVMFEIDESDIIARADAAARFAAQVKSFGGRLLVDGFCRRLVSFGPLSRLQLDYFKVDGSVIRKLPASEAAQAKVRAVVRVAASFGGGVVAECVEEQAVLDRLKALGVGYAQGFGIHKPQPLEHFAKP